MRPNLTPRTRANRQTQMVPCALLAAPPAKIIVLSNSWRIHENLMRRAEDEPSVHDLGRSRCPRSRLGPPFVEHAGDLGIHLAADRLPEEEEAGTGAVDWMRQRGRRVLLHEEVTGPREAVGEHGRKQEEGGPSFEDRGDAASERQADADRVKRSVQLVL